MTRSEFDDIRAFLADKTTHLGELLGIARTLINDLEHAQLREAELRHDYLRLLTAARASVAAGIAGEPDPLAFVRNELAEQGQLPEDDEAVRHILADARAAAALRASLADRPDEETRADEGAAGKGHFPSDQHHGSEPSGGRPPRGEDGFGQAGRQGIDALPPASGNEPHDTGDPLPDGPTFTGSAFTDAAFAGSASTSPAFAGPTFPEAAHPEPAFTEPGGMGPAFTEPALTDQVVTDPTLIDPALSDPALTDPAVTGQGFPSPHADPAQDFDPSSPDPLPRAEGPASRAVSRPRGPRMRSCAGTGRHLRR